MNKTICAAKVIHSFLVEAPHENSLCEVSARFLRECQLMSGINHPNIVQFLGLFFLPGARLPAIVMERLLMNLHDFLVVVKDPSPLQVAAPKHSLPLSLKCSILRDMAKGVAYLHEQSPPIIHRDLSARNILLNSKMVAKIADLGMARTIPHLRQRAMMTIRPGTGVYMPPEAMDINPEDIDEEEDKKPKVKYDASIDIFSFGVVAIFTLCQTFPRELLPTVYLKDSCLLGRTELERREKYMKMIYRQLEEKHPLLQMIEGRLDFPDGRPSIHEVLCLLEEARSEKGKQLDTIKSELLQALETHRRNKVRELLHSKNIAIWL